MAIAFDVVSSQTQNNTTSVSSSNFTIANVANRLLLVGLAYQQTTDDLTSVKWNTSETMTKLLTFIANGERLYIYGLLNPTATTANVTVAKPNGTVYVTFWCANYNGVSQTGLPDSSNSATGNSAAATVSTTTVANNSWLFSCFRGFSSTFAAGTNTTQRSTGSANAADIGDSNAAQTPAGSHAQNFTLTSGQWGLGVISFAPYTSAALTRTMSDSIMNGASRTATIGRLAAYTRTPSDAIMNAASRFATASKGFVRAMADSMMNAAGRLATISYATHFVQHIVAAMSDSIMNSRGRYATTKGYLNGLLTTFKAKFTAQGTTFSDKYQKQGTDFEEKYH